MPSSPPPFTAPLFALSSPPPTTAASRCERLPPAQQQIRPAAPVVVIVRPSQVLLERCQEAAATLRAVVVSADVVSLADECRACPPAAIVVTADVRAFDPRGFCALARELGARLVQLQDDHAPREAIIAALRWALFARG